MMTHELNQIFETYLQARTNGLKAVLATVVDLKGSSYRRPGVRMLLLEDGSLKGAVSGGCVEKEIYRQALEVFKTGTPLMMTYDGRYRLGCEGILYLLLEPFFPPESTVVKFQDIISERRAFKVDSYYRPEVGQHNDIGSIIRYEQDTLELNSVHQLNTNLSIFSQELAPCIRLLIFGGEHDAVQLSSMAALLGWQVEVVVSSDEKKTQENFPGVKMLHAIIPEDADKLLIDAETSVILMTHSYVKDLKYLIAIKDKLPAYLGILGPAARRERLLNDLLDRHEDIEDSLFERIHGPAGLDIGAESAQEIAVSVLGEILSVLRNSKVLPLHQKKGPIHEH